ncbi:hypothetical protein Lalb_Chr16g0382921 [Lupinus albus]|uniref:Uncharacterized protein n=1 Tax=Lupinus albus TaxID=3870 RepID=A0A6A4NTW7_LUPAL|nr:hypothetical protein Lalb_Chr16g0382921 [Lupinus albus]
MFFRVFLGSGLISLFPTPLNLGSGFEFRVRGWVNTNPTLTRPPCCHSYSGSFGTLELKWIWCLAFKKGMKVQHCEFVTDLFGLTSSVVSNKRSLPSNLNFWTLRIFISPIFKVQVYFTYKARKFSLSINCTNCCLQYTC